MTAKAGSWKVGGGDVWWTGARKDAEAHRRDVALPAAAVVPVHTRFDTGYALLIDRPADHLAVFAGRSGQVTVDVRPHTEPLRTRQFRDTEFVYRPVMLARRTITRIAYPYVTSGIGLTGWEYAGQLRRTRYMELTVGVRAAGEAKKDEDLLLVRCPDLAEAPDPVTRLPRLTGWADVASGREEVERYRRELARTVPADSPGLPRFDPVGDAWFRDAALFLLRRFDNDIADLSSSPGPSDWEAYDDFCEANGAPWLRDLPQRRTDS